MFIGTFEKDQFFFFAFSMDEKENYAYFDNYAKEIRKGTDKNLANMVTSTESILLQVNTMPSICPIIYTMKMYSAEWQTSSHNIILSDLMF